MPAEGLNSECLMGQRAPRDKMRTDENIRRGVMLCPELLKNSLFPIDAALRPQRWEAICEKRGYRLLQGPSGHWSLGYIGGRSLGSADPRSSHRCILLAGPHSREA